MSLLHKVVSDKIVDSFESVDELLKCSFMQCVQKHILLLRDMSFSKYSAEILAVVESDNFSASQ